MSAPEVGDRVRGVAGRWAGQEGVVIGVTPSGRYVLVESPSGRRPMPTGWVEKVPTTPTDGHRGDDQGADVGLDPDATNGPQNGGKR